MGQEVFRGLQFLHKSVFRPCTEQSSAANEASPRKRKESAEAPSSLSAFIADELAISVFALTTAARGFVHAGNHVVHRPAAASAASARRSALRSLGSGSMSARFLPHSAPDALHALALLPRDIGNGSAHDGNQNDGSDDVRHRFLLPINLRLPERLPDTREGGSSHTAAGRTRFALPALACEACFCAKLTPWRRQTRAGRTRRQRSCWRAR